MATETSRMREIVVTDNAGFRSDGAGIGPRNAQLVGGVWLPASEHHLVQMMTEKAVREVDGRLTYQYHKLENALKSVGSFRHAVDIGAHVGLWSMQLVKHFERLTAFEPNIVTADLWLWNVPQTAARLHRVALGREFKLVGIETTPGHTGNTRATGPGDVPMLSLDSFKLEDVDFIKIDVEGFELDVIKGGLETIARCRPVIVVEQKGQDGLLGMERDGALHFLERLGMRSAICIGGDHLMVWN